MTTAFRFVVAVLLCGQQRECIGVQQLVAPDKERIREGGLIRREHKALLVDSAAHLSKHGLEKHRLRQKEPEEVEIGSEKSQKAHQHQHHAQWSYNDMAAWPSVCDDTHKAQSPINFADDANDVPDQGSLYDAVSYMALDTRKIKNNGHNIQVDGDFGKFTLPNGDYDLIQFHFHFPSEHTINGRNAAGEVHLVHKKQDTGALAVIGMFLESNVTYLGGDYPKSEARKKEISFMTNLGFATGALPAEGANMDVAATVDIQESFKYELQGTFFHYMGSLTTPPCSEQVHWYVLRRPAAVTEAMIAAFKTLFPNPANNRPTQPQNSREIDVGKEAVAHTSS